MPVDPTDPDTFEDEEDAETAAERFGVESPEVNPADAVEQRTEVLPHGDVPLFGPESPEVDPADAADQARVVELNEDDYR